MSVGVVNKQTGDRIPTAGMPAIDNALDLTSVNPVQNAVITAALANKQDKTDNTLQTTDKTIVGAINEHEGDISSLKSGLTNVDVALSVPDGAGKNLIPMSVDTIKAANTNGTWSGNSFTRNEVTFALQTDNSGNVTGILVNGTNSSSSSVDLVIACNINTNVIMSGCPSGGAAGTYLLAAWSNGSLFASDYGSGISISDQLIDGVTIRIKGGYSAANLLFKPMIRPAGTTPDFAPYIPSVDARLDMLKSGKVGLRQYYANAETATYNIPITRAAAYIISANIPTGANSANPGLYYVVKQGTSVSKYDLITDVLGLTATISDSNLVLSWTVSNPYGANFSVIPVMEFN